MTLHETLLKAAEVVPGFNELNILSIGLDLTINEENVGVELSGGFNRELDMLIGAENADNFIAKWEPTLIELTQELQSMIEEADGHQYITVLMSRLSKLNDALENGELSG